MEIDFSMIALLF